jgi:hypothetical protein
VNFALASDRLLFTAMFLLLGVHIRAASQYRVVFDVHHPGASVWASPVLFFLAASWIGMLVGAIRHWSPEHPLLRRPPMSFPALVFPLVGAAAGAALFVTLRRPYVPLREALDRGDCTVVSGVVRELRLGDPGGFTIVGGGGRRTYDYSAHLETPGFHEAHPGFLVEGVSVRIADVGGHIARLEVAEP